MSIYDDFFDLKNPCPDSIKGCQELREEYTNKLEAINNDKNCRGCKALNLKAEYMTYVWKSYLSNMGINV